VTRTRETADIVGHVKRNGATRYKNLYLPSSLSIGRGCPRCSALVVRRLVSLTSTVDAFRIHGVSKPRSKPVVWPRRLPLPWMLMVSLMALLVAAAPAEAVERLAVLELSGGNLTQDEQSILSDEVRGVVVKALADGVQVMTRENMEVMLSDMGIDAACVAEGACEVETARNLGVDYVVTGSVGAMGELLMLSLKLHDTRNGQLLASERAKGSDSVDLLNGISAAAKALVAPLSKSVDKGPPEWLGGDDAFLSLWRTCADKSEEECRSAANPFILGKTRSVADVLRVFRSGCDQGVGWSCGHLARMYYSGVGVEEDRASAVSLFDRACNAGHATSCDNVGALYLNGTTGVPRDMDKGASALQRGCDVGRPSACKGVGIYYRHMAVPKNPGKAVAPFGKACQLGSAEGCGQLSGMYELGEGVAQDWTKSLSYGEMACEGGRPVSCDNVGIMYENGSGTTKDDGKAAEAYAKGCRGDYALSCHRLGYVMLFGTDVAKDEGKAVVLFRKSCEGGIMEGCKNLASMLAGGQGVPKDEKEAVSLFRKACDGEFASACSALGLMVRDGLGVPKSASKARLLFAKACDAGDEEGCELQ